MSLLKEKKALITGGSGALGRAICQVFAKEGADVAFNFSSNKEAAEETVKMIEAEGAKALSYQTSVTDYQGIHQMVENILNEFGRIDILVNNAGVTQVMPFPLIEEEDWNLVMDVNVKGTFITTKAVLRGMIAQRYGRIINLGSIAGMRMLEVPVHYATAKAAIVGFTMSLAQEVARYNILVNCVVPGMLGVGISANLTGKQRAEVLEHCSLGRAGKPEEIANLIAFLASDKASYINGQSFIIDGGM